jgi:alpha-L-fucosidase 2
MRPFSRRRFLAATAGASLLGRAAGARAGAPGARQRLWYDRPAATWNEALPLGNGALGAMLFGRVAQERVQLNVDTLWAGGPYQPENPEARAALPRVRELIDQKRFADAATLASAKVMARPLQQMAYGSLGDLLLELADARAPVDYERELDLESAIARVSWRDGRGASRRAAFVSAPHQVLVWRLEAPRGGGDLTLRYRAPRRVRYIAPNYPGLATDIAAREPTDWLQREPVDSPPAGVRVAADGDAALLITGRNADGPDTPGALTFALRVRAITDGDVHAGEQGLRIGGARRITLLVAADTSFVRFDDVSGEPVARVRARTDAAAAVDYRDLERAHVRDYRALFSRVSLDLPASVPARLPTDARVAQAEAADDPSLAALYFQYARYLLIASSRPGTQPANLQGIWNEGVNPPWGSKYTLNINAQMNYWPADAAGLGECVEPLLRMTEELAITGARTAREMYGARGWVTHHNTDLWRAAAPIDGPFWGLWPCGGAWLCNALWDHYDYGRDAATLRRIYPLIRGAALFFLDTLLEDPAGRGLVTSPSLSPENAHPFGSSLCAGPAMDRQILRDLFANAVTAGRALEEDGALLAQFAAAAGRLPPDRIGAQGQLQEWLEDWDAAAPEPQHRHVSHLYAVYPSSQANTRDTPALVDAARRSLDLRGDFATGWGTAWRLCLWARMGEGARAHAILKSLLGPRRTYPNLFDAHPPFQIDGNFGGAAGILEMLVQSWGGEIHLLPALPAAWPDGEIRGVRARGGVSLDLRWRGGQLRRAELRGPARQALTLRYRGRTRAVSLDARGRYAWSGRPT